VSKLPFPWIALGVGLFLALGLLLGGAGAPEGERVLPLLTMLLGAELGFFVTGAGAVVAVRRLRAGETGTVPWMLIAACAALAVGFFWLGIAMWPGGGG
jgi:hypothetical protein